MNEIRELMKSLWRWFLLCVMPACMVMLSAILVHRKDKSSLLPGSYLSAAGMVLFITVIILCIALPIIIRTLFHNRQVADKSITAADYIAHQKKLMIAVGLGFLFASVAYLIVIPEFYLYGSVLAALYGIYSIIPSEKKAAGELRFYGYSDNGKN